MVALHSLCFRLEIGKFVQLSTYPETNENAFLEFGASLCHGNSKKLVVKSRRKLTLLKRQNSPELRPSENNMRTAVETTLTLVLFTTESKNNYYLARLSKWIINLTNLDWNSINCRNNVYLGKF